MSGSVQSPEGVPASATAGASDEKAAEQPPGTGWPGLLIACGGAVLTALVVSLAASSLNFGQASTPVLQAVAKSQLEEALGSVNVVAVGAAIDDARQCRVPLAFVTVVGAAGANPGTIRVRSGAYISPNIILTDAPRRVAIPFPADYRTGRGIIAIEGAASSVSVFLTPGWHSATLSGSAPIAVTWTPGRAC